MRTVGCVFVRFSSGWFVLYVGGNWNNATNAGLFYFNANNTSSNSSTNIGPRHRVSFQHCAKFPVALAKNLFIRTALSRFILESG